MFGKILRKIFGLKGIGSGKMLHNKEISDLYSSFNIYGIMKCSRLRRPNVGETRHTCTRELWGPNLLENREGLYQNIIFR
jgi:hypothetical protein